MFRTGFRCLTVGLNYKRYMCYQHLQGCRPLMNGVVGWVVQLCIRPNLIRNHGSLENMTVSVTVPATVPVPNPRKKGLTCWISLWQWFASQYQPAASLLSTVPRHIGLVTTNKQIPLRENSKYQHLKLNTHVYVQSCSVFRIGAIAP